MRFVFKGEVMKFKTNVMLVLFGMGITGMIPSLAAAATPAGGDVYAIAHSGVILTAAELRDVYLGEKQFAGSTRLVPVDNSSIQDAFLEKAVYMETYKYASLWIRKSFRGGLTPPITKSSDVEVIEFVKKTVGAVGYISTPPPLGVTQLFKY